MLGNLKNYEVFEQQFKWLARSRDAAKARGNIPSRGKYKVEEISKRTVSRLKGEDCIGRGRKTRKTASSQPERVSVCILEPY
jgi:hypothetical protein